MWIDFKRVQDKWQRVPILSWNLTEFDEFPIPWSQFSNCKQPQYEDWCDFTTCSLWMNLNLSEPSRAPSLTAFIKHASNLMEDLLQSLWWYPNLVVNILVYDSVDSFQLHCCLISCFAQLVFTEPFGQLKKFNHSCKATVFLDHPSFRSARLAAKFLFSVTI